MRSFVAIVLSTVLMLPTFAQGKDHPIISLPRSAKWEINYDTDSCHLLAQFGKGDDLVIMQMTRFEPGDKFDLMLYGKMFPNEKPWVPVRVGFGDQTLVERSAAAGTAGKLPFVIVMHMRLDLARWAKPVSDEEIGNDPVAPQTEAKINGVTIALKNGRSYRLETGSLVKPMQALRDCTDSLLTSWGYDSKVQSALSRRATPLNSPAAWVNTNDYPSEAVFAGHNGFVQFRLDIDAGGKITGCHVLRAFKPDDFSKITCDALNRRARFSPAQDSEGKPVKSFYINQIRWVAGD